MEVSREELETRFREMSDEELLSLLRSRDLTPLAIEVAISTLNFRGLTSSALPGPADASANSQDGSVDEEVDLVTVADAVNAVEANVIRLFLESHGILASVWGEHAPVSPWGFLPGTLPRIQVRSDQVEQARELLAAMKRGDFELSATTEVELSDKQSDLEITQEVLSTPVLKSRRVDALAPSSAPSWSSTATNPVAPARTGLLSRILILAIGALLTLWLWTVLIH
jgi:Putative prokaryotic signal transducing protein